MFNLHLNKRLAGAVAGTKEPTREKKGQAVLKEALFLGLRFVLAFLLSKTVIFSEYAPFGVAFCAALGGAPGSAAAFFGSFLGYMFSVGNVDGLKYAASCVLCFSAGAIFKDTKAMSYRFFMPAVAALSLASVGFVFIGNSGKIINDVLLFVSEIILAAGSAWFYSDIFGKGRDDAAADLFFDREKTAAILVLTITVLGSLCGIYIFQIISPARVISVLLVMSAAYLGGAGSGTALGVATGIVMDAAAGNGIFFAAAYGLCALTAGAAKGKSRLLFTMIYVAANAAVSLWSAGNPQYLPGLYEAFIASVLFYLIPVQYLQKAKACLFPGSDVKSSDYSDKIKKYAGRRLNLAAGAFQELYASMSFGIDGLKRRNDEDIAAVFDCAADKVCSKCGAKHICWERDYVSTVGALNDMSVNMAKRGQALKSDFPGYFASRCLYFDQFTEALNSAMRALLQRRQYKKKLQANKNLIREQYAAVNDILRGVAKDVETGIEFHPNYSHQLRDFVKTFSKDASVAVSTNANGRMCIELDGENLRPILEEKERFNKGISLILSRSFDDPEQIMTKDKMSLRIIEAENYRAFVGAGVRRRKGESVSGDSGTYFKTEDGMLYLALSDGMGSGHGAALESASAVKLVERFLRAGIGIKGAAKTIAPALLLKNGENSYATIDILGVDLYSGNAVSVKYGAAPTYIKTGPSVQKIMPKTPPPGIMQERMPEPEVFETAMTDGSLAVILSDGVADANGDGWLTELLSKYEGDDIKKLAGDIIKKASDISGGTDDMTVLAVSLKKR